jgi:hypothetical protein
MATDNASMTTAVGLESDKKVFTLADANRALPYVSRIVDDITGVYARIIDLRRNADRPGGSDLEAEREYEKTMDRLGELVDELHAVGVELKDFELGLVDFPAIHQGRDVLLCWKRGEQCIDHWHEVDAGLSGRQPVSLLEEKTGRAA